MVCGDIGIASLTP
ncbi:hypothetical protein L1076_26450 [Vibrio sp. MMG022]|nr:hypothetical protein [Vibrio sp. MMG023]